MGKINSWVILDGPTESDVKLAENIETHYLKRMSEGDLKVKVSERILNNLGYRLEYTFMMGGHNRHVYTWCNNDAFYYYLTKDAYSVIQLLQKHGYTVVGMVEDSMSGTLQWVYADGYNDTMLSGNVFYSNLEKGFYSDKSFTGLQEIIDYPNVKEQSMIVMSNAGLTGWFSKTKNMLKTYETKK